MLTAIHLHKAKSTSCTRATILSCCISHASDPEDIRLLLDRGADATIRDKGGKRPIDPVSRPQKEIRSILKIAGKEGGKVWMEFE
ncbi:hypothetical protein [Devosia sp.]|uniref:hypothetical protein n=1 Tax=Devosia sp. TaxID=1871048 RepID=UPI002AFF5C41|nr:hypothetical protein [Devosia sp.]